MNEHAKKRVSRRHNSNVQNFMAVVFESLKQINWKQKILHRPNKVRRQK